MADPTQNLPVILQGGRAVPPQAQPSAQQLGALVRAFPQPIPQPIVFDSPTPGFVSRQQNGAGGITQGGPYAATLNAPVAAPVPAAVAPAVAPAVGNAAPSNPFGFSAAIPQTAAAAPQTTVANFTPAAPAASPVAPAAAAPALPTIYRGGASTPLNAATSAINAGFDRQDATTADLVRGAENYISGGHGIFEQATRGRAIGGILHAVAGPNNAGMVEGNAADVANQGQVSLANEQTQANEQRLQTQTIAQSAAAALAQRGNEFAQTPKIAGSATGLAGSVTQYSLPAGMVPGTTQPQAPTLLPTPAPPSLQAGVGGSGTSSRAAGPVENSVSIDQATGRQIVYRNVNGTLQWVPQ